MGKTYGTSGDEEHPEQSRIKKGDRGVGLGTAVLNGAMGEYLSDRTKVEQRPKGLRRKR